MDMLIGFFMGIVFTFAILALLDDRQIDSRETSSDLSTEERE